MMWHVFIFLSICSVAEASIRASACPCQREKRVVGGLDGGGTEQADGRLVNKSMLALETRNVTPARRKMLPLGAALHPE